MSAWRHPGLRAVVVAREDRSAAALRRRLGARVSWCAVTRATRPEPSRRYGSSAPICDGGSVADHEHRRSDGGSGARVVMFGPGPNEQALVDAAAAGASGYLSDDMAEPPLLTALSDVAAGLPAFPRRLGALLIADLHHRPSVD